VSGDRREAPARPDPANRQRRLAGVWLVTRREVVTRGRSRSFLIGLAVSVLLVGVVALLPRLFGDPSYDVGLAGAGSEPLAAVLAERAEAEQLDLSVTGVPDEAAARAAVADGELDAVILEGRTVLTDGAIASTLGQVLEVSYRTVATEQRLTAAGLDPAAVADALAVPPLAYASVGDEFDDTGARRAVAVIVVLIMMMLIYLPAIYVATGVVEEKSSRVVELLLAAIRPWQLLAGKIIGIGVLGFVQLTAIAATGLLVAAASGATAELPPGMGGVVAGVFVWFVLGYAFFGAMAAASASLVSRQEDVNGVLTPVSVLVMAAYVVGFLAAFDPGSAVARTLSIVPPFSSVVMPVRTATETVPAWQIATAIGLMMLAALLVLGIGAQIYRRAVLRSGARLKLSEVLSGRGDRATA
jgi:ABC-2 type transport system permease protein